MAAPILSIINLQKTYQNATTHKSVEALKDVSLSIPKGSIYGLLGPNGAGKSTLINILAGLVVKTSGTVTIAGINIDENFRDARLHIGVVPQEIVVDPFFTVRECLEQYAGYYGIPKAARHTDEILAALGLSDRANSKPRALSGGMKRRLLIGKALVHSPPILILDEPTAGVDVELRDQLWRYVRQLNARGTTVILTTHYLAEAQELCDHIAIINRGAIVADMPIETLLRQSYQKSYHFTFEDVLKTIPPALADLNPLLTENGGLEIHATDSCTLQHMLTAIHSAGLPISDISASEPDLEDVFRKLVV